MTVNTFLLDMPTRVKGQTIQNEDGSYSVFLNARMASNQIEKTYQHDGNGIIKNGLVGYWMGVPVVVTNNGTYDGTASECRTYMIKKGALGYVKQQDVTLEIEREGKLLANDIIVSDMYATKVMDADGIVIIRKTIA